jgi:hypothetical protein
VSALDKNEIAALLESLCDRPFGGEDRPFGGDADGRSLGMQDMARRSAPGLSRADGQRSGAPAQGAEDPRRDTAELASILSGTAADAQCHAFQVAAMTSSAVRLEAQSALAFVDGIEQAALAAPAHLVEQVVGAAGGATPRASEGTRRSGIWSRVSERWLVAPRGRMAAAFAVLLMGGGLSWSLLRGPADSPDALSPMPVAASPRDAPLIIPDPTVSDPTKPAREPAPGPAAVPSPASALVRVPAPAQALADPCEPSRLARPEALAEAAAPRYSGIARSEIAKRAVPNKQPKTAAAPDPGCAIDADQRFVVTPAAEPAAAAADKGAPDAGRNPPADSGSVRAAQPAAKVGGLDRDPPAAALSTPGSAPAAARPALPAMRPSAIAPSR